MNRHAAAGSPGGLPLARLAGIVWRAISIGDAPTVDALVAASLEADGGLPLLNAEAYLGTASDEQTHRTAIGAFAPDGRLAACAAVSLDLPNCTVGILGQVRPEWRGYRLGRALMHWSVDTARAFLGTGDCGPGSVLSIRTEALTPAAEHLYKRHGFQCRFAEEVMRRDLGRPLPYTPLPAGVVFTEWSEDTAGRFFEAYHGSFRDRPGFPDWSAEQWIAWISAEGFRPDVSFVADAGERPIGFIACADGFISQVGVVPTWRRRGIGSALVVEAMRRFAAEGIQSVALAVNDNNSPASRLYRRLGFVTVARRACYERESG